jgi:hypothetical protein
MKQANKQVVMPSAMNEDFNNGGGDGSIAMEELPPSPRRHSASSSSSSSTSLPFGIFETNIPKLCCAFLASITTGGTTYAFGLYGNALKKTLHLSQSQLDTISTANFCAGLLSWIPGLLVDRYGTRFGISLGGSVGATALMLYWSVATKGWIPIEDKELIVTALSALGVTIFLSCALVTGSVFKIIVESCGPGTKGSAVGAAKGYVGLGAGAYACLFEAIRPPTSSDLDFLPMCAFFFITAAVLPSWFFLPSKQEEARKTLPDVATQLHFRLLYASLIALASIIVGTSLLSLYKEDGSSGDRHSSVPDYPLALVIMLIWVAPIVGLTFLPQRPPSSSMTTAALLGGGDQEQAHLLLAADAENNSLVLRVPHPQHSASEENLGGHISLSKTENHVASLAKTETVLTNNNGHQEVRSGDGDDGDDDATVRNGPAGHDENDKNLAQMLQTPSAWLLLWTTLIAVGGGTVETNNMGQMVEALHFPAVVTPAALALFSVAQAGGRVVTGAISESALNWDTRSCLIDKGVPRPVFLIVASLAGVLAHTILAVATTEGAFVIGVALSGWAFGMVWPLMVLIVGEVFGTSHVAANYMFYDGFTSAAGTLLLTKIVAQAVYEGHIDDSAEDSDGVTCYGTGCFRLTHIVIVVLSMTCIVTATAMLYNTRHTYNKGSLHRQ